MYTQFISSLRPNQVCWDVDSMEKCNWCGVNIEGTKFTADIKGSKKNVCRACFFLHIKGEYDKLVKRVMGFSLSDEIPFFQKEDKDSYVKYFEKLNLP